MSAVKHALTMTSALFPVIERARRYALHRRGFERRAMPTTLADLEPYDAARPAEAGMTKPRGNVRGKARPDHDVRSLAFHRTRRAVRAAPARFREPHGALDARLRPRVRSRGARRAPHDDRAPWHWLGRDG